MMIPEAWENHESMPLPKRAFYRYHASLIEPWDGPASIAFTDGTVIGAVLDRNGLRPSRYWVTSDDLVIMASEVGVLDVDPGQGGAEGPAPARPHVPGRHLRGPHRRRRRDQGTPGRGPSLQAVARRAPRRPRQAPVPAPRAAAARRGRPTPAGLRLHDRGAQAPDRADGRGPVQSHSGRWAPTRPSRCLSSRPRLLFDYFTQLFAQVTNPPLDAIREELVTSLGGTIGPEGNLLDPGPPVVPPDPPHPPDHRQRRAGEDHRRSTPTTTWGTSTRTVLPCLFRVSEGGAGLRAALDELRRAASQAIENGSNILDALRPQLQRASWRPSRRCCRVSSVHHHLIREKTRTRVGLVVECGDAREVHHMALLIGYGAAAINPYLAFETIEDLIADGLTEVTDPGEGGAQLHQGLRQGRAQGHVEDGHLDGGVLHRRPDLRGHRPGPGPRRRVLHRHRQPARRRRPRRAGRRGGERHMLAYPDRPEERAHRQLQVGGEYQWRREGEYHLFNPDTVFKLQHATRTKRYEIFKEYTRAGRRPEPRAGHPARPVPVPRRRAPAGADRRGRAGQRDRQAVRDRRHVLRLDLGRGPRDAGHRHEPHRRQVEHRRGRRGRRALRARRERRPAPQRDQAGGLGSLRRDERVPGQRRRPADQDGPGRQAGRGRPAPGPQGVPVDRQDPALDARRRPHQPAAAPRHLLDRGPGPAHPRPQERQPRRRGCT